MSSMYARASLKVKATNTNSVQARTKAVASGLTGSAQFASLAANATALSDQSTVLDKAETVAKTRVRGSAATRNKERKTLVTLLKAILPLVQAIADQSPDLNGSIAIIEAAGLVVALVPTRIKPILAAKQGPVSGSVVLEANATALGAKAGRKGFFNWQGTADGGKTWLTFPASPKCRTSVANLTPLTPYGFRVALTDSSGVMGEWSPIVSFIVH
jgi:hypothetical protein